MLISVNPLAEMSGIYTEEVKKSFVEKNYLAATEPHIFALAFIAYNNLLRQGKPQSVLIKYVEHSKFCLKSFIKWRIRSRKNRSRKIYIKFPCFLVFSELFKTQYQELISNLSQSPFFQPI
jgi:hypothetical protein